MFAHSEIILDLGGNHQFSEISLDTKILKSRIFATYSLSPASIPPELELSP